MNTTKTEPAKPDKFPIRDLVATERAHTGYRFRCLLHGMALLGCGFAILLGAVKWLDRACYDE